MNRPTSFLDAVDAEARATWRLDSEKSFALFTYYQESRNGETSYHYNTSLEIKPYPNPLSFGGMWGSGGCKTPAELEKAKQDFMKYVNRYVPYGLTRIEVKEEK